MNLWKVKFSTKDRILVPKRKSPKQSKTSQTFLADYAENLPNTKTHSCPGSKLRYSPSFSFIYICFEYAVN